MLSIGDTVKIHYTGRYLDGTIFDSTVTSSPILFTIGDEMMLPDFEDAVKKMKEGEKKTIQLKAKDAYGDYDEDLLFEVNKKEVFGDKELIVGSTVQAPTDDGVMVFKVKEIKDDIVILDANSEMAGKDVIFEIELIEILKGNSDFDEEDDYINIDDDDDEFQDEFDNNEFNFNNEYDDGSYF